jgi:flavin reductase (DIM6/NTAB) family NADH-FMN oxidoreductase RutF
VDDDAKKAVLRLFTYGLYIVTSSRGHERNAFTANWISQVSFDPPLIALSVENDSVSLGLIRASACFGICVLEQGQRDLAGTLGRSLRRAPTKLEGLHWAPEVPESLDPGVCAPPILADCLGYVHCRVEQEIAAGDSTLLLGRVVAATLQHPGEPLTMRAAGFRHAG